MNSLRVRQAHSAQGVTGRSVVSGGFPPCTVVVGNPWVAGPTDPNFVSWQERANTRR